MHCRGYVGLDKLSRSGVGKMSLHFPLGMEGRMFSFASLVPTAVHRESTWSLQEHRLAIGEGSQPGQALQRFLLVSPCTCDVTKARGPSLAQCCNIPRRAGFQGQQGRG